MRGQLSLFTSLAIPNISHLALVTEIPTSVIRNKMQKEFIWKGKNPKIKHSTLCNKYENGGLKNADVFPKVVSLESSWIKKLFDSNFHQLKVTELYFILI